MTMHEIGHNENVAPILLFTRDAARMLHLSERTMEDWRLKGRGPRYVRVGRSVRYRLADILTYIERRTFQNTGEAALAA